MLKATMKYSGVRAKVMALYGKLLTEDDWKRLCACASITDITSYLRSNGDWSETINALPTTASPEKLQEAVLRKVFLEYERLYKFSFMEDKKYLLFILYRAEYGLILDTLRRLQANSPVAANADVTDFMRRNSSVDITALESCTDYKGLIAAIADSIYAQPMKRLALSEETGLPNYRDAGFVLENHYYKTVFSYIKNDYKGLGKQKLVTVLGTEADLLNIVSILRLQLYFPGSLKKADELLVPAYYLFEPKLLRTLQNAKNAEETLELLRKSRCRKYLENIDLKKIESFYHETLEAFCRKIVKSPEPSICVPVAYLTLRELESKKLIRLIEAVSYGVDPKEVI